MKKNIIFVAFSLLAFFGTTKAISQSNSDEQRKTEIDKTYWSVISKTVKEGDFDGYSATCHKNGILVITTGKNKRSIPMLAALEGWKQGFLNTKQGKQMDNVSFRFSQRIGDETTAHETGIFYFTSHNGTGKLIDEYYVHLEALLTKQADKWVCLMEHQKAEATQEEWNALK